MERSRPLSSQPLGLFSDIQMQSTHNILEAFGSAYDSALANQEAAAALLKENAPQSAALSILALEEVGKMMLIDGLLFAREDDERYRAWKKGRLSHGTKLDALELYPLFLHYLSFSDPRREESAYRQTMVAVQTDLKKRRNRLVELFGEGFGLVDLDTLKQRCFYSHEINGTIVSNRNSIEPLECQAVFDLAFRVIDSLKFVLGESSDNYRSRFAELRAKADDADVQAIRDQAPGFIRNVFGFDIEEP